MPVQRTPQAQNGDLAFRPSVSAFGMPPLQLTQHGPEQLIVGQGSNEGSLGNRADKNRRVAALGCPAEPLAEFGVGVGGVVDTVTHLLVS